MKRVSCKRENSVGESLAGAGLFFCEQNKNKKENRHHKVDFSRRLMYDVKLGVYFNAIIVCY